MRLKCVTPCVNQETGKRHQPGDVIDVGQAEGGRLLAFKCCVPVGVIEPRVERQVMEAPEKREKGKPGRKPKEEKRRYSGLAEFMH